MNVAGESAEQETIRRAVLAQRLAAVATLADELAHEVRNPLNCALLQLAVLQRRLEQPDCHPAALQPVAELVEQSLRRLEMLFNDFLAFSLLPSSALVGGGRRPTANICAIGESPPETPPTRPDTDGRHASGR
jgi:signal transduction histidine kinase